MEKIYIKPECYAKIMFHVRKSNVEVSGLGRVQKLSDGSLMVSSIYLLEQENSAAATDIDPEAVAKLMYETREDPGDLNFWWHSHVNMDVFWSGTDMATIHEFGKNGYLLSTVFNKKNELRTSYYQGAVDFYPSCFIDEIETRIEYIPTSAEAKEWDEEHEEKCKAKVYTMPSHGSNYFTGKGQQSFDGMGDGDLPDHFNDPHFWQNEGGNSLGNDQKYGTEETYSGMNPTSIVSSCMLDIDQGSTWDQLAVGDEWAWHDLYEIHCGKDPDDKRVSRFYKKCLSDKPFFLNVCEEVQATENIQ